MKTLHEIKNQKKGHAEFDLLEIIHYRTELDRLTNILISLLSNGGHSIGVTRAVLSDFLCEDYIKIMSDISTLTTGEMSERIIDYYDYQVGSISSFDKPDWLKD